MSPDDFDYIVKLLSSQSGLVINKDKIYLLESRLMPVAYRNKLQTMSDLIKAVRAGDRGLIQEVIEAMTTNESFFFRDMKPFDQFKELVLPYFLEKRAMRKKLRIWCAAASSGQEPYSIAMLLKEHSSKIQGWNIEIIGTDISLNILDKAKSGKYTRFEVQRGLPINYLIKYFKNEGEYWFINDEIKNMVQFKPYNLLEDLRPLGFFDVVFCRNVLIYFDLENKKKVLEKTAGIMEDDGFLYLGGAETIMGITEKFKVIQGQRGIYSKNIDSAPTINDMSKNTAAITPVKPILSNSANSTPLPTSILVKPAISNTQARPTATTTAAGINSKTEPVSALSALERLKQKQQQV